MRPLELEPPLGLQISRRTPKLVVNDVRRAASAERNWDLELGRLVDQVRTKEVPRPHVTFVRLEPLVLEKQESLKALPYPYSSDEVRAIFGPLADQWEAETEFLSMTPQITGHPAYFEIVGLGPPAVPLILERLKESTRPWFQALTAMTRENPAAAAKTHSAAAQIWLEWGRRRGLID